MLDIACKSGRCDVCFEAGVSAAMDGKFFCPVCYDKTLAQIAILRRSRWDCTKRDADLEQAMTKARLSFDRCVVCSKWVKTGAENVGELIEAETDRRPTCSMCYARVKRLLVRMKGPTDYVPDEDDLILCLNGARKEIQ